MYDRHELEMGAGKCWIVTVDMLDSRLATRCLDGGKEHCTSLLLNRWCPVEQRRYRPSAYLSQQTTTIDVSDKISFGIDAANHLLLREGGKSGILTLDGDDELRDHGKNLVGARAEHVVYALFGEERVRHFELPQTVEKDGEVMVEIQLG